MSLSNVSFSNIAWGQTLTFAIGLAAVDYMLDRNFKKALILGAVAGVASIIVPQIITA